jgi:hypothetical protein
MGIVVFLAVAGTIYQNMAIEKVRRVLVGAPESDAVLVTVGTSNPVFEKLAVDVRTRVVDEIISAMSNVWALLMAGMALSFILSFFLGVGYTSPFPAASMKANQLIETKAIHGRNPGGCLDGWLTAVSMANWIPKKRTRPTRCIAWGNAQMAKVDLAVYSLFGVNLRRIESHISPCPIE